MRKRAGARRSMSLPAESDIVRGCIADAGVSWVPPRPRSTPEPDLESADKPNRLQIATPRIVALGPEPRGSRAPSRRFRATAWRPTPCRSQLFPGRRASPRPTPSHRADQWFPGARTGARWVPPRIENDLLTSANPSPPPIQLPYVEDVGVSGVITTGSPVCGDHLMTNEDGSESRAETTSSSTARSQYSVLGGS
jgi:hypothetical protein